MNNYDGVIITSRDVPVTMPVFKFGYRTERAGWPELVQIIGNKETELERISRSEEDQREYEIFRHHLKRQYKSGTDYILITKFKFSKIQKDGLWEAQPQLRDFKEVRKILIPNDFPYYMVDGVVHYVLWKTNQEISEKDILDAKEELKGRINATDFLHWMNPHHLKSLPEIDHVHILCLLPSHTT